MSTLSNPLKNPAKVAIGMLIVLFIGSIYFYRERIFTDSAFIATNIINTGHLQIQCERYGSFITQMFPLIAVKLHLPLKALLIAYSASFNLFYLAAALLFFFRFKDYPLVILMTLYYSLYVTQTYFWTNNELQQGVCWMFITFATLRYMSNPLSGNKSWIRILFTLLVFSILAFISIFTHPGVIFPFMFLWIYYWLEHKEAPFSAKWVFVYLAIIITICGFKYFYISSNNYDNAVSTPLVKLSPIDVVNAFTNITADRFWKSISTKNWILPIIFIITLVVLFRQKKYRLFSWILLSSVGYFAILCITFTVDVDFYIESEFMPLTIFGGTAFVYYVLPQMRTSKAITLLLAGIFIIRTCFILYASDKFTARVKLVTRVMNVMKQQNINKMVLLRDDDRFENESIATGWGMPYESLLHSGLNGDAVTATFIYFTRDQLKNMPCADSLKDIMTMWGAAPKNQWNNKYFHTDSLHPYAIRTYEQIFGH